MSPCAPTRFSDNKNTYYKDKIRGQHYGVTVGTKNTHHHITRCTERGTAGPA